ncbi:MAG: dipeptide/oligopeptide/nickel transporter permease [Acidimicrobiales bacterium]|nr:dipeptide/oligopeptide/nickel transporter permease [Acidimicrobiales bacterium]
MFSFIVRRILVSIPLLFLASFIAFILVVNTGDPLEDLRTKINVPKGQIALQEHRLGLDKPFFERYFSWLTHAIHGDWGRTIKDKAVWDQISRSLGVTLKLVVFAEICSVLIGVTIGIISAVKQYSWFDHGATTGSFLLYSLPVLAVGSFLKFFLAIRLNRLLGREKNPLLKTIGESTANFCTVRKPQNCGLIPATTDFLTHAALPTLTLVLITFAGYARFARATMLETLNADYVRTARAKGLDEKRVILKHAFRNALIPVVTVVSIDFGGLIGGAILTETIFEWKGMGRVLVDAVTKVDPNLLLCWFAVTAIAVVLFNLVADILYAVLDPRIRL